MKINYEHMLLKICNEKKFQNSDFIIAEETGKAEATDQLNCLQISEKMKLLTSMNFFFQYNEILKWVKLIRTKFLKYSWIILFF